jgi:hypothetical protein
LITLDQLNVFLITEKMANIPVFQPISEDVFPQAFKAFVDCVVIPMMPMLKQMTLWEISDIERRNFAEYYMAAAIYSLEKMVFKDEAEMPVIFGPLAYDVCPYHYVFIFKDYNLRCNVYYAFKSLRGAYVRAFSMSCRDYQGSFHRIWTFTLVALTKLMNCVPPEVPLSDRPIDDVSMPAPPKTKNPPTLTQVARKTHIKAYGMEFMKTIRRAHFEKNIEQCFLSHREAIHTINMPFRGLIYPTYR